MPDSTSCSEFHYGSKLMGMVLVVMVVVMVMVVVVVVMVVVMILVDFWLSVG